MLVEFYLGILLNEMKFPKIESLNVAVVISDSISNIYIFYISHHCLHFCHSYYKSQCQFFVELQTLLCVLVKLSDSASHYRARVNTPQYANLHTFAYWLLKTQTHVMPLKYIWISSIEFCHILWHYNINLQTVSKKGGGGGVCEINSFCWFFPGKTW